MLEFTFILLYASSIRALSVDHNTGASTLISPDVPVPDVPLDMGEEVVASVPVAAEAVVIMLTLSPLLRASSMAVSLEESIVKSTGSNSQLAALTVMSPILSVSPEVSTVP